jgi:putative oxidoreductase
LRQALPAVPSSSAAPCSSSVSRRRSLRRCSRRPCSSRTDHRGKGFWIYAGGAEYVLTNAIVVVGLAFNGAGHWSLDNAIGWDVAGLWWGVGTAVAAVIGAASSLVLLRSQPSAQPHPA